LERSVEASSIFSCKLGRVTQILGNRSRRWINLVFERLIFVDTQYANSSVSLFRRLEYWSGFQIFGNRCCPFS